MNDLETRQDIAGARLAAERERMLQKLQSVSVDRNVKTPAYQQIFEYLLSKLKDGTFRHGDMLPSDNDLVRLFNVSRITAQRAMSELVSADLARRERGRGTRVKLSEPVEPPRAVIRETFQAPPDLEKRQGSQLLSFDYVPAPADVADRLQLERESTIIRSLAVQTIDQRPEALHQIFLPTAYADIVTETALRDHTLYNLLSRAEVPITHVHQTIGATSAYVDTAAELDVPVGAPLVQVKKLYFDENDRPVFYSVSLYKSHYEYAVVVNRSKFGAGTDGLKPG